MNRKIEMELQKRSADVVRFVDISGLPTAHMLGLPKAILLGMALTKQFVNDTRSGVQPQRDEYLEKEHAVEQLADKLAELLRQKGYRAHSQSERSNTESGTIERAYINPQAQLGISAIAQKTIARLAGLGFIGKNNLLVTREYGCAICICSVLTDAPVTTAAAPLIAPECGTCDACVRSCPSGALRGNTWTPGGGREALLEVDKCYCPLACMMACPWTIRYAQG